MTGDGELGFGACRLAAGAVLRFAELCHAGSRQTGLRIVPRHLPSYEALGEALEAGTIKLAWAPPIVALDLLDRGLGVVVALPERHGLLTSSVAFVVRHGGPRSLEELRGRRVMWLDRRSASGYVVPRLHLFARGWDPRDFFSKESFAETHMAMLDAVATGTVDVGTSWCRIHPVTRAVMNAGWLRADGHPIRQMEIAHIVGPVPNDAILAARSTSATDRSALVRWLLHADEPSRGPLTDLLSTTHFRVPTGDHFEPLRHMLRAARARGYDAAR